LPAARQLKGISRAAACRLESAEQALRDFLRTNLEGSSAKLYRDLYDLSQKWGSERRRDLLVRYLGFPLWDALLFPIQALAEAGENDGVTVQRICRSGKLR
jgi:hypothetical protein